MKKYFIALVIIVGFFSFLPIAFADSKPGDACSASKPCTGQYNGHDLTCVNNSSCGIACTSANKGSISGCAQCVKGACSIAAYEGNACEDTCSNGLSCVKNVCVKSGATNTSGNQSSDAVGTKGNQSTDAASVPSGDKITLINPLGSKTDLPKLVSEVLGFVVKIGAMVVVFMLIWVGWMFVKAQGVPGDITKARQALLWTVIGGLILLGAQVISIGIQATVNSLSTGGDTTSSVPSGTNPYFPGASTVQQ